MIVCKQLSQLLGLVLLVITIGLMSSCETDIPEVDNTAPTLRLNVFDNRINEVMENPPIEFWVGDGEEYLQLIGGNTYSFSLLASDLGGVNRVDLQVPNFANLTLDAPATMSSAGLSTFATIIGDESNPLTGLIISGTVSFPAGNTFDISASALDYGGQNGPRNARNMIVTTVAF